MNHLIEKFGKPRDDRLELPYQREQILGFIDECQSLINDWEAHQRFDPEVALLKLEMIEAMASSSWDCEDYYSWKPDSGDDGDESANAENVRRTVESITNMTTQMRHCILSLSSLPELASLGICQHCNRVLRQALFRGIGPETQRWHDNFLITVDTWPRLPTLQTRSKLSGCQVCGLLRESLQLSPASKDESFESRVALWFHCVESDDDDVTDDGDYNGDDEWTDVEEEGTDGDGERTKLTLLHVMVSGRNELRSVRPRCTFSLETTNELLSREFSLLRPPLPTCWNPTSLDFIKEALSHSELPKLDRSYCPRRLLDLGLYQFTTVRIIEEPQATVYNEDFRYAALSYCWGRPEHAEEQLRLTQENRESLCYGIAEADMTPVVKDAITVCHALSIRFLWVDALCILQGSSGVYDWEEQSFGMSRIFSHAWVTICTPASTSCLDGFLKNVDRQSPEARFEWPLEGTRSERSGTLYLKLLTRDSKPDVNLSEFECRLSPLDLDLWNSSWTERGWIFQERILSPRKVFFGSRMVHVQNNDIVSSENRYRGVSRFEGLGVYDNSGVFLSTELLKSKGVFVSDFWYSIIAPFPLKVFTSRADILPALSGVARLFSEVTGHNYMAGLWKQDLHCGLLWTRRFGDQSLDQLIRDLREPPVIAPSWSWVNKARFGKFVITPKSPERCRLRRHLKAEFSLLRSEYAVEGNNPLGRLSQASLTLRGRTITPRRNSITRELVGWIWERTSTSLLYIEPDWFDLVMSRRQWKRLRFLLIASCCSQMQTYMAHKCWRCGECVSDPHIGRLKCSNCHTDFTQIGARIGHTKAVRFFEDGEPNFNPAVGCSLCTDKELRRDIWGLVIFSAGKSNSYYRVGTFCSRAVHGGSDIFCGAEDREVVLI